MKRLLLICLILVACLGLKLAPVQAQPTTDNQPQSALSVSPAIVEHVIASGQQKQLNVQLTNITRVPLPITTLVRDFTVLELSPEDQAKKEIFDASKWFKVTEPDFILQPNQTRSVQITVSIPEDAVPGGHYATIYFRPLIPEQALSASTAYLNAQVGVLAFLIVPGEITENLSLESLKDTQSSHITGPITFSSAIKNDGNTHLLPDAKVIIKDWRGKQVAELPVKPSVVLPETTKPFEVTWTKRWLIGKYTAQTVLRYGTDSRTIQSEVITFWVIPWLPTFLIALPIVLITLFVKKTRSRWKKAWSILRNTPSNNTDDSQGK